MLGITGTTVQPLYTCTPVQSLGNNDGVLGRSGGGAGVISTLGAGHQPPLPQALDCKVEM